MTNKIFCSHYTNFREREINPDRSFFSAVVVFCNLPLILGSRPSRSAVREAHFCSLEVELIFMKITKFDANRCQILRRKCTKLHFLWGSAPDPVGGTYSAPPDLLAVFKGPTSKGKEGREEKREKRGREGEWDGREQGVKEGGRDLPDQCQSASYAPDIAY